MAITKQNPLQDFFDGFLSLFKGMGVTGYNLLARRKITEQYPYERRTVSPRYRGLFYLPFNEETKRLNCTGCTLCEQACPTNVISMTKLGSGKHGGVSEFNMDLGRCMFCNLCIEACPFEAIYMGPAYELASTDRNASKFDIKSLAQGGAASAEQNFITVTALLEAEAAEKAAKAATKEPAAAGHGSRGEGAKPAAAAGNGAGAEDTEAAKATKATAAMTESGGAAESKPVNETAAPNEAGEAAP